MATLFEAYVTNAGKYSEGQLVGETLKFPTTAQDVEALLKRIGVDGVRYQEIFITSFDGDVLGLYDHLSEYENLDELNHLACLLSELTSSELETLEAVLDSGDHCSSVRDIIIEKQGQVQGRANRRKACLIHGAAILRRQFCVFAIAAEPCSGDISKGSFHRSYLRYFNKKVHPKPHALSQSWERGRLWRIYPRRLPGK